MLKLLKNNALVKVQVVSIYNYLYKFSLERLQHFLNNESLMLLFVDYLQVNGFQRIHMSPNMVKYRHAYYEACNIMINQSTYKKHLSEYYDFKRIFRTPTEEEFDNELAQNSPLRDSSKEVDCDFDEDLDDNFSEQQIFGESDQIKVNLDEPKIESEEKKLTSYSQPSIIIKTLNEDVLTENENHH